LKPLGEEAGGGKRPECLWVGAAPNKDNVPIKPTVAPSRHPSLVKQRQHNDAFLHLTTELTISTCCVNTCIAEGIGRKGVVVL